MLMPLLVRKLPSGSPKRGKEGGAREKEKLLNFQFATRFNIAIEAHRNRSGARVEVVPLGMVGGKYVRSQHPTADNDLAFRELGWELGSLAIIECGVHAGGASPLTVE